ncbi:MAG: hypothetical protein FWE53_00420 [Firmicutes bacterium]|nr:hypothetical protein [Bacillota bacterium]
MEEKWKRAWCPWTERCGGAAFEGDIANGNWAAYCGFVKEYKRERDKTYEKISKTARVIDAQRRFAKFTQESQALVLETKARKMHRDTIACFNARVEDDTKTFKRIISRESKNGKYESKILQDTLGEYMDDYFKKKWQAESDNPSPERQKHADWLGYPNLVAEVWCEKKNAFIKYHIYPSAWTKQQRKKWDGMTENEQKVVSEKEWQRITAEPQTKRKQ